MPKNNYLLPSDKKRERIVKAASKTNPTFGKNPSKRTIDELLKCGIINLDKPCGPTSHQVDSWVKNILDVKKVGHHGTLDPNATGVLPIAVGNAAKSLQVLLTAGKEYIALMRLHKNSDKNKIIDVMNSFVGSVTQLPPVRSAVKREKRTRIVYYVDIIQIKDREVLFRVGCESGTYIRTLCVGIGKKLKTGAHLAELRRSKVGNIIEEDSCILQDLKDAYVFWKEDGNENEIRKIIHPVEKILEHLPKIIVRDSAVGALCHGASLAVPGILEVDSDIKKGEIVAILTLKNEGVAIGKSLMTSEEIIEKDKGVCANLVRVIMKKSTYPQIWKKS
jgi:H/ACA ribonucleoprotein complex subunit 4